MSAAFDDSRSVVHPTPLEFWRARFHPRDAGPALASGSASAKDGPQQRPRVVAGLGDEAFWVGSQIAGALYMLQGGSFMRVSVGGVREESVRIEKSRALARAALARRRR